MGSRMIVYSLKYGALAARSVGIDWVMLRKEMERGVSSDHRDDDCGPRRKVRLTRATRIVR